ncbi:ArsR/SmtB family transcription factor [Levilactobacillus fujinensis]|uniref:ArsR/SmtB family transcription factor n=1 Tax=Levilactobacillus fujinensis TaxID=2486024 RepID=A0ABW1THQ1_9LACO|nr:ArsR family transcriptional regulator [Levilactobacillus fujinensis]
MEIDLNQSSVDVLKALASPIRLRIIDLLSKREMNIQELSAHLHLSKSIVSSHVNQLERAKIIETTRKPGKNGVQKISRLRVSYLGINFPNRKESAYSHYETRLPIGHYVDYDVDPVCGLATTKSYIGHLDDPKYFMDPDRVNAGILWFAKGYVDYKVPNLLDRSQTIQQVEISFEVASEFPFTNDNWPSDISFELNGIDLGFWESPGDYADVRGELNPEWWPNNMNQYGLLKTLQVTHAGTFVSGEKISDVTIDDFSRQTQYWNLRLAVKKSAQHVGGLTLYGKGFGNHDQDINFRFYYL